MFILFGLGSAKSDTCSHSGLEAQHATRRSETILCFVLLPLDPACLKPFGDMELTLSSHLCLSVTLCVARMQATWNERARVVVFPLRPTLCATHGGHRVHCHASVRMITRLELRPLRHSSLADKSSCVVHCVVFVTQLEAGLHHKTTIVRWHASKMQPPEPSMSVPARPAKGNKPCMSKTLPLANIDTTCRQQCRRNHIAARSSKDLVSLITKSYALTCVRGGTIWTMQAT